MASIQLLHFFLPFFVALFIPFLSVKGRTSLGLIAWQTKKSLKIADFLKFVYSEKATNFRKISTLLLSTVHTDKSKVEIFLNFVAFSEYMNFNDKSTFVNFKYVPLHFFEN